MKRIFFLLLLIISFLTVKSETYDSLQVSLLTIAPRSKAVYTVYGHTALRLFDPSQKTDVVFNWGVFDFDKPNFIYRFVKGETDYSLSTSPTDYFNFAYSRDGAMIIEQVLNIPDSEKEGLVTMLETNLLPENVEYRYNFFFDNCTTRPRNIIEKFCGGELVYPAEMKPVTFRQLVHGCTHPYPWVEFGIDCVIGSGADSLISTRSGLFLPERLMETLNHSFVIYPDGSKIPLVNSSETIVHSAEEIQAPESKIWDSPCNVGYIIFLISIGLLILDFFKKRYSHLFLSLLFLVAGIGGCIVFMICFFSVHPCTNPNWNILWLHPLHFIGCIGFGFKKSYPLFRWYHGINFVLLSGLLLCWHWIPQELNPASVPFILSLWIISGYKLVFVSKKLNS
jgi:hypothetical protein